MIECGSSVSMGFRKRYFTTILAVASLLLTAGCVVRPDTIGHFGHADRAGRDRRTFQAEVAPVTRAITLSEAMARAIKFNLDNKLKVMEEALDLGRTRRLEYDLLPRLSTRAGYTLRGNTNGASSESLLTGVQSLEASTSAERGQANVDLSVSWNVLDFGVSYIHAKQQTDRYLVAGERRRKVLHNIIQEVRQAYWRALTAQTLLPRIKRFLADARQALADAKQAEERLLQPPLEALRYQMGLLETIYQITTLQRDLGVAKTQLAALMNLELTEKFVLAPPAGPQRHIPRISYDHQLLERMALLFRPELREADYQKRIDALETRKAILQMLPGLAFNGGYNHASNRYLYNQSWAEGGVKLAWNLINLASADATREVADARERVGEMRRLSLGMAVLTQVHVAQLRYRQVLQEYRLVRQMSHTAERIRNRTAEGGAHQVRTGLEMIQARAKAIYRLLQQRLAYAELQNAAGRLYLSVGVDPLPETLEDHDLETLVATLDEVLQRWDSGVIELGHIEVRRATAKPTNGDAS